MAQLLMNNLTDLHFVRHIPLFQNLPEKALLLMELECKSFSLEAGATVFKQGDSGQAMYAVISGELVISQAREDGRNLILKTLRKGEVIGERQLLSDERRSSTLVAGSNVELLKIPGRTLQKLLRRYPQLLLTISRLSQERMRNEQLRSILADLLEIDDCRDIEAYVQAGQWCYLTDGDLLMHKGEPSNDFYVTISGCLKALTENADEVAGQDKTMTRGDLIGEFGLIMGGNRTASVKAVRSSVVVRFSVEVFEDLSHEFPNWQRKLTHRILRRMQGQGAINEKGYATSVAIIALDPSTSIRAFSDDLRRQLVASDTVLHLSSSRLDNILSHWPGIAQVGNNDAHGIYLSAWLDEQEASHDVVVYEADLFDSPWTRRCLLRADQIIVVGDADRPMPDMARSLPSLALQTARLESERLLVLMHSAGKTVATNTQDWLDATGIEAHQHLRWGHGKDFARLGRFLTHRAVGLVLGGGGARGFAHIGILRALFEADIPVDFIGGTSIGAVIGAQYAQGYDINRMIDTCRRVFVDIQPFKDYTIPIMALTRSKRLDFIAEDTYKDRQIEDLWTNFFCVSSNLTDSQMMIHRNGPLGKLVRASGTLPGIAQAAHYKGKLLVDGGLFNNLPSDVMKRTCRGKVIAVDVSSMMPLTFGESDEVEVPSPWQVIWSRINPFGKAIEVPTLVDILMRTATLSNAEKERLVAENTDFSFRPPVEEFGLLEFEAIDEIIERSYQYATGEIGRLKAELG